MHLLTVTRSIPAPVADVYAVLAAVDLLPEWATSVESVELLDPLPVRAGTRFRETRCHGTRRATVDMTITALEPGELIEVSAAQGKLETISQWRFEEEADDATRVTFEMALRGPGLLMTVFIFVLALLMRGVMRRCIEDDLNDLSRFLAEPLERTDDDIEEAPDSDDVDDRHES